MNDLAPGVRAGKLIYFLHTVEERLEAALEPLGLSVAKFGVLAKLVAAGEPLPLGTLAERMACVRSNMTQLIDRLEADQLVRRVADPGDRRSVRAELTKEGREHYAAALKIVEQAECELFSGLPKNQQDVLLKLLGSLKCGEH
ncbi:MAG TPA: MarR family transcriptional regulator [Vicinamibacteria bacterium]|jgi:DNA-binding MarR family transcriptional regulator|nr:MarR family transcriptional regulator [Vicinamibacteria bacterium]